MHLKPIINTQFGIILQGGKEVKLFFERAFFLQFLIRASLYDTAFTACCWPLTTVRFVSPKKIEVRVMDHSNAMYSNNLSIVYWIRLNTSWHFLALSPICNERMSQTKFSYLWMQFSTKTFMFENLKTQNSRNYSPEDILRIDSIKKNLSSFIIQKHFLTSKKRHASSSSLPYYSLLHSNRSLRVEVYHFWSGEKDWKMEGTATQ